MHVIDLIRTGYYYWSFLWNSSASNYIENIEQGVFVYSIAQVVAMDINNRYLADEAISNAESTGEYSALSKALRIIMQILVWQQLWH